MFIKSKTSMFNEITFREMLLSSLGNVNDYVAHIKENMLTWMETIELADLGEKKLHNATK